MKFLKRASVHHNRSPEISERSMERNSSSDEENTLLLPKTKSVPVIHRKKSRSIHLHGKTMALPPFHKSEERKSSSKTSRDLSPPPKTDPISSTHPLISPPNRTHDSENNNHPNSGGIHFSNEDALTPVNITLTQDQDFTVLKLKDNQIAFTFDHSLEEVCDRLFWKTDEFFRQYHKERGDKDVVIHPWRVPSTVGVKSVFHFPSLATRKVSYTTHVNFLKVKCKQLQQLLVDNDTQVRINIVTKTETLFSISSFFQIEQVLTLTKNHEKCTLTCKGAAHYLKSQNSIMRKQTEITSQKELSQSFSQMTTLAKKYLSKPDENPSLQVESPESVLPSFFIDPQLVEAQSQLHAFHQSSIILVYTSLILFVVLSKIFL